MFKQTMMAMAIVTAAQMLSSAPAEARFDPLRCEARRAGCEKRYYKCLSRCTDGAGSVGRPARDSESEGCEANCDERHGGMMDRINSKAPCVDKPFVDPADPNDCEVQLLNARRTFLVRASSCLSRAERDGFDVASCEAAKHAACELKVEEVLSHGVCSKGRAGTAEICEMP